MGKNVVVIGAQWGDEGKGKIVDWLTEQASGVVRFNGGHNAGHTLRAVQSSGPYGSAGLQLGARGSAGGTLAAGREASKGGFLGEACAKPLQAPAICRSVQGSVYLPSTECGRNREDSTRRVRLPTPPT